MDSHSDVIICNAGRRQYLRRGRRQRGKDLGGRILRVLMGDPAVWDATIRPKKASPRFRRAESGKRLAVDCLPQLLRDRRLDRQCPRGLAADWAMVCIIIPAIRRATDREKQRDTAGSQEEDPK